ncbi:TIGR03915 family putative DNA repair protein [Flavobacterium sp.]|uniref:TIGR03915 family putative DNA repair protein n=1 Tax=Flavobacterium sp. TaxID=239 RepID=UPI00260D1386|nr:TIGR03915 family putative DNA repair protein [Flavobacterium sp.]MDD3003665.1 TIGR03915 family putative DNA repair protein [Flavobacterium sp.]
MTILFYDKTFEGFLTAVFEVFEYKYSDVQIVHEGTFQNSFFAEPIEIISNPEKADRVLKRLEKQLEKDGIQQILHAFLSENADREKILLQIVNYALNHPNQNILKDFSNPDVMQLSKLVKSVHRESHRMKAFIRFELLKDGLYFAEIFPDFDVLTLIITHFKNRYQDQKWLIYDSKRGYGVYYDLTSVEIISIDRPSSFGESQKNELLDEKELNYQKLWIEYFDHTNIKERKNDKLHVQHVPKRYWKYLTEKKIL